MKCLIALFALVFFEAHALDVDSKLVARILGVSGSKKTVLINKGKENGLKEGDHAKVSLPTGMIARAVVVKVSPTRSVWSVYRFFDKDSLSSNIAITLKIASPVKLTKDESKHLGQLAEKVDKKTEKLPEEEKTKHKQEQLRLKNQFIKSDRVISQFDNMDYSALEDSGKQVPRDPDIDWDALDGKKDKENISTGMDFTRLR